MQGEQPSVGQLRASGRVTLPPDPGGTVFALKEMGYSFQEAIADLVDNSIDARATEVRIVFHRTEERVEAVSIVDNGAGISSADLDRAMTIGAASANPDDLGKFGMGMKTASFSQADTLTVLSRTPGAVQGRRWSTMDLGSWECEIIEGQDVSMALVRVHQLEGVGTAVAWSDITGFRVDADHLEGFLTQVVEDTIEHLALHFHRFLSTGRLGIRIEIRDLHGRTAGPVSNVRHYDPFDYPYSGPSDYPKAFVPTEGPYEGLELLAHVWPKRETHPNYRLGGGQVAARQGFYFYRNDRLIQAGGWNGLRSDAEPHLSLARVEVDLPTTLDDDFGLNVNKTKLEPTRSFLSAVKAASASDGTDWSTYLKDAERAYRERTGANARTTHIPGKGSPRSLKRALSSEERTRNVEIRWASLETGRYFEIDNDGPMLVLDRSLRALPRESRELAVGLLFILLESEFGRERESKASRARADLIRRTLKETIG